MRDIEFRVWIKPNNNGCDGEMVYEDSKSDYQMISNGKSFDVLVDREEWLKQEDFVLMLFTGFIHNEKKVFQDDTFKVWLEDSVKELGGYWWNVEVKQHLGCWILAQAGHDYKGTPIEQCELLFTTEYELIPTGNIHDKTETNEN